jgi:hypothetical protein
VRSSLSEAPRLEPTEKRVLEKLPEVPEQAVWPKFFK